jgi:glycosyltransferase involved in cell wall biosynthesis
MLDQLPPGAGECGGSRMMFSVVVPTIGRESLPRTLASINREYAEAIVVADAFENTPERLLWIEETAREHSARYLALDAGFHDTGSSQIALGMREARGDWLLNCGDDDVYEPFAFETMARAIALEDRRVPFMFRVALHPTWPDPRRGNRNIVVLWHTPEVIDSWVTGQCFVVPNIQDRLGSWLIRVDIGFMQSTVDNYGGVVAWREELIAQCY